MSWLPVILGYLLGSFPTAYIAGCLLKGRDIRLMGDGNVGARNAYFVLSHIVGVVTFFIDTGKGALAIFIANAAGIPQGMVLLTGAAAVAGHNWPVFLGFRGGRGESTAIGILYVLAPLPMLVVTGPAFLTLLIMKHVATASAVLFAPLWLVCWLMGESWLVISYSIFLPVLVGFTHYLRTRGGQPTQAQTAHR